MRAMAMGFVLMVMASAMQGQQPAMQPPADTVKDFTSSADVTAMIAKAKSERKEGQPLVSQRLLQMAPYSVNLEYRPSVGPASLHEQEAEIFYVVDGAGTLVTGGKLVGETRSNATNLTGTGIEGGTSRKIAKGDFIMIPEKTPHWFSAIDQTLVLMSAHVPRPVPATP